MYYIGLDLGSSSIKAAIIQADSGKSVKVVTEPEDEMEINAPQVGWAEQDPETWWKHVCRAIKKLLKSTKVDASTIKGIGISYQMHGLVLVNEKGNVLRNSIIWCDSRAVEIGKKAFQEIGEERCTSHLLNSPANFTASKLKWVKENEPTTYRQAYKMMLPGDFIAFKLSGTINTTLSGLSEGIFWDFKSNNISNSLLEYYGLDKSLIPEIVDTFSVQSTLSKEGAIACGLAEGIPILYRAGDQPNNALSLNVFNPGEVAATGGTSGVLYAVTDSLSAKETTRVNNFAHVNYSADAPRIGKLLNINGAGIMYRWLKENLKVDSYEEMNQLASKVNIGSEGAIIIPFGNGAERMLENEMTGMQLNGVNFNIHNRAHLCRAALEGIAFSFVYGMEILKNDETPIHVIRAGNDNLFRSEIFADAVASLINQEIEIYNTTGAIGAARAAGLTDGAYKDLNSVVAQNDLEKVYKPRKNQAEYTNAYLKWKEQLKNILKNKQ
ncbi:FGGY family carbohydrate kinase [Gramella sp. AN32]|uniref:Xylulokinase n=1 Tax=Christiangramia antarctica TaxID=2058158 RepID=A0ABW5X854_9FLAO|nr:FGGY family carbohydrate kinase [Gramella sp. AN32]MCM4154835.1 carbohydrate kinase [Gramella sp. AN32]